MTDYRFYVSKKEDARALQLLDHECSAAPFIREQNGFVSWQKNIIPNYWVTHVTYKHKPISYMVAIQNDAEHFRVLKIGVTEKFRRKKVASYMLARASAKADKLGCKWLDLWIRETQADTSFDSWDLLPWLRASGFEACEVREGLYTNCGYAEAGYRFRRSVRWASK